MSSAPSAKFFEGAAPCNTAVVFYTGSDALDQGIGLCYDHNRGTATDDESERGTHVERPSTSNNRFFAGYTTKAYRAKSGGQEVEIYLPGGFGYVSTILDTTINATVLTVIAGGGTLAGLSGGQGFSGRGSALARETTTNVLESLLTGATGALDAAGTTLTDSAATFVTAGVQAGDRVVILGGEDNGTNATTAGVYTVASVTSETVLVLTEAASDGGTMQVSYVVNRGNRLVFCYLMDGEESGLIEYFAPPSPGHASSDTTTVMQSGKTYILGGYAIATGNARAPLAEPLEFHTKKGFFCLGALATSDFEVELDSDGIQLTTADTSYGKASATGGSGAPLALHAAAFDAASEVLYLEWCGAWREQYHSGCSIDAA
jgi:hypothetical protein